MTNRVIALESFVRGYYLGSLWTETDEHEEPLNHSFDEADISVESQQKAQETCADFLNANFDTLELFCKKVREQSVAGDVWQRAGTDFWLTRNGHGAGFWDRGTGEPGDKLTQAAKVYGTVNLVIGSDGKLHYE